VLRHAGRDACVSRWPADPGFGFPPSRAGSGDWICSVLSPSGGCAERQVRRDKRNVPDTVQGPLTLGFGHCAGAFEYLLKLFSRNRVSAKLATRLLKSA